MTTKTIDLDAAVDWYCVVKINGEETGVNLYELQLRFSDLHADLPPDVPLSERYKAYRKLLADEFAIRLQGLDKVNAFLGQFNRLIADLEKKAGGATGSPAASPGSTDSMPSTGLPNGSCATTPTSDP